MVVGSGFPCRARCIWHAWRPGIVVATLLTAIAWSGCATAPVSLADATPEVREREQERRFDRVERLVRTRYYARDLHGLDWDELCARRRPEAVAAPDAPSWYAVVNGMLRELRDAHTRVERPRPMGLAAMRAVPEAAASPKLPGVVSVLSSGTVVVRFDQFDHDTVRWLRGEIAAHQDAPAVVIDLRRNRGGLIAANQRAIGLFFRERVKIGTAVHRNGRREVERSRSGGRVHYAGPLAVLVGPNSHSSAEVFARTMQYYDRAQVVGLPTAGEVLGANPFRLRDGGVLYVSTSNFFFCDGRRLEGRGVTPDVMVIGMAMLREPARDAGVIAAERALAADTGTELAENFRSSPPR